MNDASSSRLAIEGHLQPEPAALRTDGIQHVNGRLNIIFSLRTDRHLCHFA